VGLVKSSGGGCSEFGLRLSLSGFHCMAVFCEWASMNGVAVYWGEIFCRIVDVFRRNLRGLPDVGKEL